ncbi:hypothetical protein CJ030_MR6G001841 [Morella rubra]|uniref:Uncharacterized protein n=1 Tax=Morella rubra TaxID=262757 RepID=A0A6A1VF70_9ROSI|nr:hypothetical protein CJ030_MR6G001841 [Morella rubra]
MQDGVEVKLGNKVDHSRRRSTLQDLRARHAHELEKEKQVPIDRAELYKAVHSRSDGSPMNPDVAEKIFTNFEPIQMGGNISWSPSDRYAQVIGPERHCRIRGVGLGPTPSSHPTNPNIISTQPESSNNAEMIEMQDQMKMMHARLTAPETMVGQLDFELRKAVEVVGSNLKAVASSAELQAHMRWVGDMVEHIEKVCDVLQLANDE